MIEPAHLNDEQVARYSARTAGPAELLELDDHLSGCAECRDRVYFSRQASGQIVPLRAEITGHLQHAEIVTCSEGMTTPEQWQHLQDCPTCRGDVQDLSRFRSELRATPRAPVEMPRKPLPRWAVPAGIAAAALLIAGGGVSMLMRRRPEPPPAIALKPSAPAPVAVDTTIPAADQQTLELATSTHRLERAPILDNLITQPGTLLAGKSDTPHFDLLGPVGTTVLTDRPVLRWMPVDGATAYVVSIFDEHFVKVVESPAQPNTDWRPDKPLPRGRILNWQVTAKARGANIHAPTPPAPEARFEIVPQDVADHIAATRRDHPGNPLLLAALLAKVGALDDAEMELKGMESSVAQPYRESLVKIRKP